MKKTEKQNWEAFYLWGKFDKVLKSGETIEIETSFVEVKDKNGDDTSIDMVEADTKEVNGSQLGARIIEGTIDKSPYLVSFKAHTSLGNKYKTDMTLEIIEPTVETS